MGVTPSTRRNRGAPIPRGLALLALVALITGVPSAARASGAWETHLRAKTYSDLLVTKDFIWCATGEAGLLRFDRTTHAFSSITREPGAIASNHLTSLAYDRVGRLWVGTVESGVSRLTANGASWELVNAFDGLPVDSVTAITVSGDTLWIGTRHGIALWDGREVLGSLPDGNTVSFDTTFAIPAITGIVQMRDTLWLSTVRGIGFAHISSNLSDWRQVNAGLPSLEITDMATDGLDLLAVSNGLVFQWRPDSLKWLSTGLGFVHRMRSEHGEVLAASNLGTYVWTHFGFVPIANGPMGDAVPAVDSTGTTHYSASAKGLSEQPASPGAWPVYTPPGPPGNGYSNIVIDGARVYAATRNEGIGRWDGASWFAWLPGFCNGPCPNDFRQPNEVFAMLADRSRANPGGQIWAACWQFAVDRFDDATDPAVFTHYWLNQGDDLRHTLGFGAAADSNGGRWFGMDTNDLRVVQPLGLDFYDSTGTWAGTWGPGLPAGSLVRGGKIRAITVDKTGRIWVGYAGAANSGVDHFVRRPEVGYDFKTVANTASLDVWGIVAHGDSIWVLTDHDLRRINRTGSPPRVVQTQSTPAGRPLGMRLMDVAPNGDVFVGSEEGLRWYRTNGTTQDFTIANSPIASDDVRAIAVDRRTGVVWIGTAEGLNRFNPAYQPPALPVGVEDSLRVYPNPATLTGAGLQLRLIGASAGYSGGIYDLRGRLLHRFSTANQGQIFWNGRDDDGEQVRPGIYFVRAEGGGRVARARFVLLH